MMLARLTLVLCLFLLFRSAVADVSVHGFGSLVMGLSDTESANYIGYGNGAELSPETRFAIQSSYHNGSGIGVTGQLISRGREDYEVELEWAYVQYTLSENTTLNFGRLRTPFYHFSEVVDVGFSNHWIRVPDGVYSIPFNNWEGIGGVFRHSVGQLDARLQLQLGHVDDSDFKIRDGSETTPLRFSGASFEYMLYAGPWTLRLGALASQNLRIDIPSLERALKQVANLPKAYRSNVSVDGDKVRFVSASAFYDNLEWIAGAEYTRLYYDTGNIGPDQDSAYLTLGRRWQSWTVHATLARDRNERRSHSELSQGLDLQTAASLQGLSAALTSAGGFAGEDSRTWSVGVNRELTKSMRLKLDFSRYSNRLGNREDASLLSMGVDFVF